MCINHLRLLQSKSAFKLQGSHEGVISFLRMIFFFFKANTRIAYQYLVLERYIGGLEQDDCESLE